MAVFRYNTMYNKYLDNAINLKSFRSAKELLQNFKKKNFKCTVAWDSLFSLGLEEFLNHWSSFKSRFKEEDDSGMEQRDRMEGYNKGMKWRCELEELN